MAELSVGEVARLTGLTVRTLHHYDDLGLVVPGGRSASNYRLYAPVDLERLHRVVGYRELGLGLDQIKQILDDPDADPIGHLRRQHALLTDRIERLQRMLESVDKTLEAKSMGIDLTPEELFEVFGDQDPTQYAEEAEQRWGDTDAYRDSQRRTSSYTKADWLRMKAEAEAVEGRLAELLDAGVPADTEPAMTAAEEHRRHISAWFYDCPLHLHVGLAQMYLTDPRFTEHYEQRAPGLAQYVHDAITANAAHQEPVN